MKNILKVKIVVALFAVLLSSCGKDYLETKPTDAVAAGDAFATTENAKVALNGIHRLMYYQHLARQSHGGQSHNMIYMDMLGEDLVNTTAGNGWWINEYKWITHRNANAIDLKGEYLFYYEVIGNANPIIANIDNAVGPEGDKNMIKGSALAYRAWSYFSLVQMFGKRYDAGGDNSSMGVSMVLTPDIQNLPRSSVAEVYTQINKDLDDAIALLGNATARPNKSYQDLKVVKGLKARVALTQQNWTLAAQMAAEARAGYTLMSEAEMLSGFNNISNREWMWGMAQQADQQTYFYSFFAYMGNFSSTNTRTNPKAINSVLYNLMSATDTRRKLWDPTGTNTSFPLAAGGVRKPYMSGKFLIKPEGGGISIGDLPFMRASEMYLIEAEANARAGKAPEAQTALYTLVKQRDPSYVKSTNTGDALINEIMIHRRIELWGEGFRFYDLKRLNLDLNRTDANHDPAVAVKMNVPAGDKEWQFLIPQDEINASNGVIKQNDL